MNETIYTRVAASEKAVLVALALEQDRSISWLIRDALIARGYLQQGR
jgi:hypothetical protein